jgi:hypothetical protein
LYSICVSYLLLFLSASEIYNLKSIFPIPTPLTISESLGHSTNMSTKIVEVDLTSLPTTTDDPPPPYKTESSIYHNPGFCEFAFRERQANREPGGGMTASQYFSPCKSCSFLCGDEIPASYKTNWPEWVDPSVNFRWESHVASKEPMLGGLHGELLGCWICWEYEQSWVKPMVPEDWYAHMRKHFKVDGYRICKGKTGAMQRRRNCGVRHCPKIHS